MENQTSPSKSEEYADVINYLEESGCCCRCILRLLGERDYKTYSNVNSVRQKLSGIFPHSRFSECMDQNGNTEEHAAADETSPQSANSITLKENPSKRLCISTCISCIGLLQNGCEGRDMDKIIADIEGSGCKFTSFVIHLSLPVTIELREHLIVLHLQEKYPQVYTSEFVNKIPTVKDVWKWAMGSYVGRTFKADFHPHSSFQISVQVLHESFEQECNFLLNACPEAFPAANLRKKALSEIITHAAMQRVFQLVPKDKLKELCDLPPKPPNFCYTYATTTCSHQPLYLAGRYNKYSRKLSQTPWVVDGERRMETSVQEIIENVVQQHIPATKVVFSSSGREDVDVQMLGRGRPFVLEFINPLYKELSAEKLRFIQHAINKSTKHISVRDLQIVQKDDLQNLKVGEEGKKKVYTALCCASRQLTEGDVLQLSTLKNVTVKQKTPIRVLHRRTLSIREKTIYSMSAEVLCDHMFRLRITTQAGTYIKEFVHGDFGRTMPHLGTLLDCDTDILELDVEEIELDWPPELDVPCEESNEDVTET